MAERRDLLKMASALPLSMFAGAAAAQSGGGSGEGGDAAPVSKDPATVVSTKSQPAAPPAQAPATKSPVHHDFPNYHLLGDPDAAGNLLGTHRPTDWASTKVALQQALQQTANPHDPIHAWLSVFRTSFDERAIDIIVGAKPSLYASPAATSLRYEPQLYDATLRGAAALLDRCLRYRNDMGSFEVSGVTAGLSYLTFIKTKPLQRNYLEQSNNADLAELEHETDKKAADEIGRIWGLLRLIEWHQLRARQAELAGSAASAGLEVEKFNNLSEILKQQFNIQSDAQLAQFTRLLTSGSASNFAEKYLRTLSLLVEDLTDAYCKLFSAAMGVLSVAGLTQVAIGQSPPIPVGIPAFSSAAEVRTWVAQVAPQTAAERKPDLLDALVLWCRAVMRTLDAQAQFETEFTVSIPLCQPSGKSGAVLVSPAQIATAFSAAGATGVVPFTLSAAALPIAGTLRSPRIVGIGLSVEFSSDDQSPLQYTSDFPSAPSNTEPTPTQVAKAKAYELKKLARVNATVTSPPQALPGGTSYVRPKLFVPNIRLQGGSGGDAEATLTYDLGCRGLNPFGPWTINFDKNMVEYFQSAGAITDGAVTGVVVHLRLRGTLS